MIIQRKKKGSKMKLDKKFSAKITNRRTHNLTQASSTSTSSSLATMSRETTTATEIPTAKEHPAARASSATQEGTASPAIGTRGVVQDSQESRKGTLVPGPTDLVPLGTPTLPAAGHAEEQPKSTKDKSSTIRRSGSTRTNECVTRRALTRRTF
jgi:hypothetical protein